jgi:hypothetical protein
LSVIYTSSSQIKPLFIAGIYAAKQAPMIIKTPASKIALGDEILSAICLISTALYQIQFDMSA